MCYFHYDWNVKFPLCPTCFWRHEPSLIRRHLISLNHLQFIVSTLKYKATLLLNLTICLILMDWLNIVPPIWRRIATLRHYRRRNSSYIGIIMYSLTFFVDICVLVILKIRHWVFTSHLSDCCCSRLTKVTMVKWSIIFMPRVKLEAFLIGPLVPSCRYPRHNFK